MMEEHKKKGEKLTLHDLNSQNRQWEEDMSQTERSMRQAELQRVWEVKMKPMKESKKHLKIL